MCYNILSRGCSSADRASHSHCEGRGFKSHHLHHGNYEEKETAGFFQTSLAKRKIESLLSYFCFTRDVESNEVAFYEYLTGAWLQSNQTMIILCSVPENLKPSFLPQHESSQIHPPFQTVHLQTAHPYKFSPPLPSSQRSSSFQPCPSLAS